MKEQVQLLGSASYAEVFKRYCALRETYEREDIHVETHAPHNGVVWDATRLEAQRLFALAARLQLDVSLVEYSSDHYNPRAEGMGFGKIVAFHNRYNFNETELRSDRFDSWDDLEAYLLTPEDEDFKDIGSGMGAAVVLPLYMLDHSGLAFSTAPFACRWDSGQIGFIYATQEDMRKHNVKSENEARENLRREVELFDIYQRGEIYEYTVHFGDVNDWEAIDEHGESRDGFFYEEEAQAEGERAFKQKCEALRRAAKELMPKE